MYRLDCARRWNWRVTPGIAILAAVVPGASIQDDGDRLPVRRWQDDR